MSLTKKIERSGKRFLIRLTSRLITTPRVAAEEIRAAKPQKILVIRQQNQMGDMILATPAYRAIKETLGDVELGVVTAPINRNVLLNHPYVDRVFTYNNKDLFGTIRLIRDIRKRRYDLVIILHTVSFSFTSAVIGLLSGARFRAGSTSGPFGNMLSESFFHLELPLPGSDELAGMNEAEHNLYPLRGLNIDSDDLCPVIVPSREDVAFARDFLERNTRADKKTIVVHPGAGKAENIWPPENFAEVVNRLRAEHDLNVCVIEGPRDAGSVGSFSGALRGGCVRISGRGIGEVAAVLPLVNLVLCNDTGVMHVACAVGARTLAVFGPTDPVRWAPRCPSLEVVRAKDGNLRDLTPEVVAGRALDLLKSINGTQSDLERK